MISCFSTPQKACRLFKLFCPSTTLYYFVIFQAILESGEAVSHSLQSKFEEEALGSLMKDGDYATQIKPAIDKLFKHGQEVLNKLSVSFILKVFL